MEDPLSLSVSQENGGLMNNVTAVAEDESYFIDLPSEVKAEPEVFELDGFDLKYPCKSEEEEKDPLSWEEEQGMNIVEEGSTQLHTTVEDCSHLPISSCGKLLYERLVGERDKSSYGKPESYSKEYNTREMQLIYKEYGNNSGICNFQGQIRNFLGKKTYACNECGRGFTQSGQLKRHMRIHTGERPYSCHQCKSSFCHSGDLKKHIRTHTGEKPFTCTECHSSFSQSSDLKKHIRTHTGEKPFICDVCGNSFPQSNQLKIHLRTHTREKPYTCFECKNSFTQLSSLKMHMRIHTGEKPYTCTECHSSFSQSAHLKAHMRSHTGEKRFICTKCPVSFSHPNSLKVHMRTHTGESIPLTE